MQPSRSRTAADVVYIRQIAMQQRMHVLLQVHRGGLVLPAPSASLRIRIHASSSQSDQTPTSRHFVAEPRQARDAPLLCRAFTIQVLIHPLPVPSSRTYPLPNPFLALSNNLHAHQPNDRRRMSLQRRPRQLRRQ